MSPPPAPSVRTLLPSLLFVGVVLLRVVLRFYRLDHKEYWHDEVLTSLRLTGHSFAEAEALARSQKGTSAGALAALQELDRARGIADIIRIFLRLTTPPGVLHDSPPLGSHLRGQRFGSS